MHPDTHAPVTALCFQDMASDDTPLPGGKATLPGRVLALAVAVIIGVALAAFFAGRALGPAGEDESAVATSGTTVASPGSAIAVPGAAVTVPGRGRVVLDNLWFGDDRPNAVVRVEGSLDPAPSNWTFVTTAGTALVPRTSDHGNGNTLLWLDRPLPESTAVRVIRYQSGDDIAEFVIE